VQIVGEGVEDRQRALRREVEDVPLSFWKTARCARKYKGSAPGKPPACTAPGGQVRQHDDAVHSGTVTPVVSWPTDRVMVLPSDCSAFAMAARTLSKDLPTATASVRRRSSRRGSEDDCVALEDLVLLEQLFEALRMRLG